MTTTKQAYKLANESVIIHKLQGDNRYTVKTLYPGNDAIYQTAPQSYKMALHDARADKAYIAALALSNNTETALNAFVLAENQTWQDATRQAIKG